jgi:hypothetical protein
MVPRGAFVDAILQSGAIPRPPGASSATGAARTVWRRRRSCPRSSPVRTGASTGTPSPFGDRSGKRSMSERRAPCISWSRFSLHCAISSWQQAQIARPLAFNSTGYKPSFNGSPSGPLHNSGTPVPLLPPIGEGTFRQNLADSRRSRRAEVEPVSNVHEKRARKERTGRSAKRRVERAHEQPAIRESSIVAAVE